MNRQRLHQQDPLQAPIEHDTTSPAAGGLLQQAQAFAQVAREALDACHRGAEAERELHRRRNRSGQ
ncbi:MAG TPA: hypothetical protein VML55_17350 [Planctomycetaceae bacterium]|nr:hypothetical protein [Planctomycetaceae bacterium]